MSAFKNLSDLKNVGRLRRSLWYTNKLLGLQKRPKIFKFKSKKKVFRKRHVGLTSIHGIVHIKCSLNNTIITLTDLLGNNKSWVSCGSVGFKGAKRSSRFAGQAAVELLGLKAKNLGYKNIVLHLNGMGRSRNSSVTGLKKAGLGVYFIKDFTAIAHNGCRPSKLRRL